MKRLAGIVLTGAVLFVVWETASRTGLVDPVLLPAASAVFGKLGAELTSSEFYLHLNATLCLTLGGFMLSVVVGVPLGIVLGLSRRLDALLIFYVEFLRSLPAAALIPMFLVLFTGDVARTLVIGTACGLIMAIGSRSGVLGANKARGEVARLLGWRPYELFRKLLLWETLPQIALSARIALSTALILAVVLEMLLGARYGLGDVLINSGPVDKARMYAIIIVLGCLGYTLNLAFRFIEYLLQRIGFDTGAY